MSGKKTQNPKSINVLVCVTVCDECVADWKTGEKRQKDGENAVEGKLFHTSAQVFYYFFFLRFPVSHQADFDKRCVSHGPAPRHLPTCDIFS